MSTSTRPADSPAVRARELSVQIDHLTLLAPTTFTLRPGAALVVTGANGAGKTTLLRVLAGTRAPSAGEVHVLGDVPDERAPAFRARVAALLDPPPLPRALTLAEYLTLVATSWGVPFDDARTRSAELLDELSLAPFSRRFPHELSSGEGRLYALAVVLARPSSVLILDEPEQRLDAARRARIADALERRSAAGTTLVLASHSTELTERLGESRLHLEGARVD